MTIYIDSDYKCYLNNAEDRKAVETDAFDRKCKQYIEGCRFIPAGERWILPDGSFFSGEMVSPWRDYSLLSEFQELYEEDQAKSTEEIAAIVEEVYNSDMEVIENV